MATAFLNVLIWGMVYSIHTVHIVYTKIKSAMLYLLRIVSQIWFPESDSDRVYILNDNEQRCNGTGV